MEHLKSIVSAFDDDIAQWLTLESTGFSGRPIYFVFWTQCDYFATGFPLLNGDFFAIPDSC